MHAFIEATNFKTQSGDILRVDPDFTVIAWLSGYSGAWDDSKRSKEMSVGLFVCKIWTWFCFWGYISSKPQGSKTVWNPNIWATRFWGWKHYLTTCQYAVVCILFITRQIIWLPRGRRKIYLGFRGFVVVVESSHRQCSTFLYETLEILTAIRLIGDLLLNSRYWNDMLEWLLYGLLTCSNYLINFEQSPLFLNYWWSFLHMNVTSSKSGWESRFILLDLAKM